MKNEKTDFIVGEDKPKEKKEEATPQATATDTKAKTLDKYYNDWLAQRPLVTAVSIFGTKIGNAKVLTFHDATTRLVGAYIIEDAGIDDLLKILAWFKEEDKKKETDKEKK
ncbi:MAG: hypothetical protein ACP5RI_02915 [Candidatus Micrarchaeia archaeon]